MRKKLRLALLLVTALLPFVASATKSLSITYAKTYNAQNTFYSEPDGTIKNMRCQLILSNTGDEDFAVGDEGYTFTLMCYSYGSMELVTFPIPEPLAAGETEKTMLVTVPDFDASEVIAKMTADNSFYKRWDIRENISNTSKLFTGGWITITPMAPNYSIVKETLSSELLPVSAPKLKFGYVNEDVTFRFRIRTTGGAELSVTGIDAPEGVTVSPTSFTLPGLAGSPTTDEQYQMIEMTISAGSPVDYDDVLTIHATDLDDRTVPFSATVVDPEKFFEDFELPEGASTSTYFPEGWVRMNGTGSSSYWSLSSTPTAMKSSDNDKYVLEHKSASYNEYAVTPKLHVEEGQTLKFDAMGRSFDSQLYVYYSPDRSNWTKVKGLKVRDLAEDDEEFPYTESGYSKTWICETYTLDNIPAGDWFIAFDAMYCYINNVYGFTPATVSHDAMITASDLPKTVTANNEYAVSVSVKNLASEAEAAGSYTVKLYVDGEVVDEVAETPEIAAGDTQTFNLSYYPHVAGTYDAYAEITVGDMVLRTVTTSVTCNAEVAAVVLTIGEQTATNGNVPLCLNYNKSQSQMIYTADLLARYGLSEGAKIAGVKFYGYTSVSDEISGKTSLYMKATDAESVNKEALIDFTDDDLVYSNDEYAFVYTNSKVETSYAIADFSLSEPFVYAGGNLAVQAQTERADYGNFYFFTEAASSKAVYRRTDNGDLFGQTWNQSQQLPILTLLVQKEPSTFTGTLRGGDGNPVAGQEITLVSANGNAVYNGTTADDGTFCIEVFQPEWEYNVTIDNPDNKYYTAEGVTFVDGEPLQNDITLEGFTDKREFKATIKVEATNGAALEGLAFSLTSDLYEIAYPASETVLDADGQCVVNVYGGKQTISIQAQGTKRVTATFNVNRDTEVAYVLEEAVNKPYGFTATLDHDIFTGKNDVVLDWNREEAVFFDDFEGYDAFTLDFAPWSGIDGDKRPADRLDGEYANAGLANYGQIINPFEVKPMWDIIYNYTLAPFSGRQYVGFVQNGGVANDWIITPAIEVGEANVLRFYARSADATDSKIVVGVTEAETPAAADFRTISEGNSLTIGYEEWTPVTIDLADYAGKTVKFGIHNISPYGNVMAMVDDFFVGRVNAAASKAKARRVVARSAENPNETFVITMDGAEIATTTDYSYTVENVAAGEHVFGIYAKYVTTQSEAAEARLTISDSDYAKATFEVTTNNGVFPENMTVALAQASDLYYLPVAADGKAEAAYLPKGTYLANLEVEFFDIYSETIEFNADKVVPVELKETIVTPFNITVNSEETEAGKFDVTVKWNQVLGFADSFEDYDDFATGSFGDWTTVDNNTEPSYPIGLNGSIVTFPGACTSADVVPVPPMVFNPFSTQPSMESDVAIYAPDGVKSVLFMGPQKAVADKWLISPAITVREDYEWSLVAKAYDIYPETLEFCVSTTDTKPESFKVVDAVQPEAGIWTKYSMSLDEYAGQDVYLAVHYVSNDGFIAQVDKFEVGRAGGEGEVAAGYVKDYDVSLDDAAAEKALEASFEFTGVEEGPHTVAVIANYASGSSEKATYVFGLTSGVDGVKGGVVKVEGLRGLIRVTASSATDVTIYDAAGRVVAASTVEAGSAEYAASRGVYVVTVAGKAVKVIVR